MIQKWRKRLLWMAYGAILSLLIPMGAWALIQLYGGSLLEVSELGVVYSAVSSFLLCGFFGLVFCRCSEKISAATRADTLTGVFDRSYLLDKLSSLLVAEDRYSHPLTIVMVDLNDFHGINKEYGFLAGDKVLLALGKAILRIANRKIAVGRLSNDQFLLLCPAVKASEAEKLAAKLIKSVTRLGEKDLGTDISPTLSIGIYEIMQGIEISVEEVLGITGRIVVDAKNRGVNQVVSIDSNQDKKGQ